MWITIAQATTVTPNQPTMTMEELIPFVWQTWSEGGWLMIPLALLAAFIYFEAMALVLRLGRAKLRKIPRDTWITWIDEPSKGTGHVGEVIRFITEKGLSNDTVMRIDAVKKRLIPEVNQKITVLSVLVTVAPLMGLLGTVIGMLSTFRALSNSNAQAVELVAEGIRVALITTQTGLMIAIPGYIFLALIVRSRNRYLEFLTEVESVIVQRIHRQKGEAA